VAGLIHPSPLHFLYDGYSACRISHHRRYLSAAGYAVFDKLAGYRRCGMQIRLRVRKSFLSSTLNSCSLLRSDLRKIAQNK
jgi:hypothetical protein